MSENPWLSIWLQPKATIQRIVAVNPNRSLWLLAAIYGFSSLLNLFQSLSLGSALGVLPLLLLAVIVCPIWGYLVFAIWSWVVAWTGSWLKGKGNFACVRSAYSWSCVPLLFNIIFWLVLIALFGRPLFYDFPSAPLLEWQVLVLFLILIAKVVLVIWSLVIYLNALAAVQQFSVLRAIGNVLLSGFLLSVAFALLWLISLKLLGAGLGVFIQGQQ